jgi:CBS-domain-containing membrane protein
MCPIQFSSHLVFVDLLIKQNKQTPWSESASEVYRPSDRRFSAKWLPTFADKGRHVVSVTDPSGRILGFLDRSRYFSIK